MASTPIDQTEVEALRRQLVEMQAAQAALQAELAATQQAHVDGSGAAAQGGGDALGAHSVQVQGDSARSTSPRRRRNESRCSSPMFKSTFGANVLLAHAQAWQGHDDELGNLG